ncbi:hypothetical protein [Pectobacterium sp. B2J-2]|uniref:hypothetical protein n=1 Tax=Pectobacterium sp. B2J-2 TaxID=3385372 RepID=UPI0038FCEC0D
MNLARAIPAKNTKNAADNRTQAVAHAALPLRYHKIVILVFGQDPRAHAIPKYTKKSITNHLPRCKRAHRENYEYLLQARIEHRAKQ